MDRSKRRPPAFDRRRALTRRGRNGRADIGVELVGDEGSIPDRNLMTPPELATDAPVSNSFVPLLERLRVPIGNESQIAISWRVPMTTLSVTRSATRTPVEACPMAMLTMATAISMRFIGSRTCTRAMFSLEGGGSAWS